MITPHALLHSRVSQALSDLSDPALSEIRSLVKGGAPGKLDLVYQLFPRKDEHRDEHPARFEFVLPSLRTKKLGIMVSMVENDNDECMVFGFIAHSHWFEIKSASCVEVEPEKHFVAVRYNLRTRLGCMHFYKEMISAIEKADFNGMKIMHEFRSKG